MQVDFGLISIIMAAYNAEKTIEQEKKFCVEPDLSQL